MVGEAGSMRDPDQTEYICKTEVGSGISIECVLHYNMDALMCPKDKSFYALLLKYDVCSRRLKSVIFQRQNCV